MHAELFPAPSLPGLSYRADVISPEEEAALLSVLAGLPVAPFQFRGWEGRRQVLSFGWRYDFNDASFTRSVPIPDALLPLRGRAAASAGVMPDDLVQSLVARYDPGAGIGWHRDRPVFGTVVGLSLGAPATLRFLRRREGGFDRFALLAEPRSAYVLTGAARHDWEHSIAPLPERRWSVTFRTLAERGRLARGGSR